MRSTLPNLARLSLLSVLALIASRDVVALRASAAQQSAAPAPSGDESWPPAGAFRPGNGVILPRVLREVRPQYTSAAMRERVEGKAVLECIVETDGSVQRVRILRSLDSVFGLDEQAVRAAKQWRFAPGTKDNVAVPVMITIELTFTLGSPPRPADWPEPFTSAGDSAIDISEWAESVSEVSGLQIRVSYPKSWMLRKDGASNRLLLLQSASGRGTRTFFVENPKPVRVQIGSGVTTDMLQRLADGARQRMTTPAGSAEVKGVGQARVADRFWIWYDLWLPARDASNMPPALMQAIEGSRLWTFVTTEGAQEIAVGCVALYPRNTSDADKEHELQQAGAQFAAMLKRMSIQSR